MTLLDGQAPLPGGGAADLDSLDRHPLGAEQLRALLESMVDGVVVFDRNGKVLLANPAAARLNGLERSEQLQGEISSLRSAYSLSDLGGRLLPLEEWPVSRILRGESAVEVELRRRRLDDGREWIISFSGQPVRDQRGGIAMAMVVMRDVTATKRAEERIAAEVERLAVTLRSIGDAVIATDHAGRVTIMNPVAEALTGWTLGDASGRPLEEIFPIVNEATRAPVESLVTRVLREGKIVGLANHTVLLARDGVERPIADSGAPIRDTAGQIIGVVLVFRDQTEERLAAQALAESEERYRGLVEQSLAGIYIVRDGRFAYVNPRLAAIFGYTPSDLLGLSALELVEPSERAAMIERSQRFFSSGASELRYGFTGLRRDGTQVEIEAHVKSILHQGHPAALGLLVDVTERKQAEAALHLKEEQLRQAQKVEAIGRLTGGIAHDFNNLLTVILARSHCLLDDLPAGDPRVEEAQEIRAAAERAASLTRQLLAYSRKQVLEPRVLDLNALIGALAPMLGRMIGEDIVLRFEPAPGLGAIKADPSQLEQVVMNLVVNARDAMPDGGTLTLRTGNTELAADADPRFSVEPGPYVTFSVTDTGSGMSVDVQRHLFEPFFTTKEQGKGTGLGLSTSYGVVKQSEGHIWVESEPGQGSTFRICLPRVASAPQLIESRGAGAERGGSETILLIDDDDQVRRIAKRILETRGYQVLEATGRESALSLSRQHPGRIDLLLSDVVMPGASGPSIARLIKEGRPGMTVLFMSGFTEHAVVDKALAEDANFLQKPFSPSTLAARVREVLDGPSAVEPGAAPRRESGAASLP